ncbi:hypothetical protein ACU686_06485 [Yinghuangia aomiensis]
MRTARPVPAPTSPNCGTPRTGPRRQQALQRGDLRLDFLGTRPRVRIPAAPVLGLLLAVVLRHCRSAARCWRSRSRRSCSTARCCACCRRCS